MTASTEMKANTTAISTSRSAASMATPSSILTSRLAPGGSSGCRRLISSCTPRTTSSTFAFDWASIPMPTPALPLVRIRLRLFSAASCISATSPKRTKCPPVPRPITRLRKSSTESRPTSVRSENSRSTDSSRPAGSCTFSRRKAFSISPTVSARAANACRSIQIRIAARRAPPSEARATPGIVENRSRM